MSGFLHKDLDIPEKTAFFSLLQKLYSVFVGEEDMLVNDYSGRKALEFCILFVSFDLALACLSTPGLFLKSMCLNCLN